MKQSLEEYAKADTQALKDRYAKQIAKLVTQIMTDSSSITTDGYIAYLRDFLTTSVYNSPGGDTLVIMAGKVGTAQGLFLFETALDDLGQSGNGQAFLTYILDAITNWAR